MKQEKPAASKPPVKPECRVDFFIDFLRVVVV